MGFFDRFKTKKPEEERDKKPVKKVKEVKKSARGGSASGGEAKKEAKAEMKVETKREAAKAESQSQEIKGKSQAAFKVLLKPLITEKGTNLAALNKYIFAVNPRMNKIEIKKAIRSIYNVNPIKVNISNFSGKQVRYGRRQGKTKDWKKAIVTLKPGDKIEVYEGV